MNIENDIIVVNTNGLDWPLPLIELKKALVDAKDGQTIEVYFTCPEATTSMPTYCEENNHEIIGFERLDDCWKITLQK